MDSEDHFKKLVAVMGDPVRAVMLWNLLDGRALTATELAIRADVSAQNASMHLKRLITAKVLSVENQGRHRYYRISRPEVAYAVESLGSLAHHDLSQPETKSNDDALGIRYCRTCYDHLAGKVGVLLADQFLKLNLLVIQNKSFVVTGKGARWFTEFGIPVEELRKQRRSFARHCLDWSERRYHVAGALGAALLKELLKRDWIRSSRSSRAIKITEKGRAGIYQQLKLTL
jgi:DNA-binding transcriptional ArsR family regulator